MKKVRKRVRRKPEEARALILEATKSLIHDRGPDRIGLKDIAARAGVTHGLVTHYFGTKESLIEEAIVAQSNQIRDHFMQKIQEITPQDPVAWLERCFDALQNLSYARLAAWVLITGRYDGSLTDRMQGPKQITDQVVDLLAHKGYRPSRENIDFAVLLTLCAGFAYTLGGPFFLRSLGLEASEASDRWFRKKLGDVFRLLLDHGDSVPGSPPR